MPKKNDIAGLVDLQQTAKNWLGCCLDNFSTLLGDNEDPSLSITLDQGVVLQLRAMTIPGHFERVEIAIPATQKKKGEG